MPQIIQVRVQPAEAEADLVIKQLISQQKGVPLSSIQGFILLKKSIDARGKTPWVNLTLQVFINEPVEKRLLRSFFVSRCFESFKKGHYYRSRSRGAVCSVTTY